MNNTYQVYLISDSTGEPLDRIFLALQAQFSNFQYKSHQYSFTLIDNNEFEDLAQILRSTLGGLHNVLNNPSYNIIFHNWLNEIDSEIHWHIEIIPQLSYSTGFKSGVGISVNSLIPEKSAEILGKASRKELASLVGVI